jgi:hypothetical protein
LSCHKKKTAAEIVAVVFEKKSARCSVVAQGRLEAGDIQAVEGAVVIAVALQRSAPASRR